MNAHLSMPRKFLACSSKRVRGRRHSCSQGHRLSSFVRTIEIDDEHFNDKGLSSLCDWAPHCENLSIYGEADVSGNRLRTLAAKLPHLKSLDIDFRSLSNESLGEIVNLKDLEDI